MTRIKNIILLVLALSLCLATVSADENSRFYITEVSPSKFQPSQEGIITITIRNDGSGAATQVTGEIDVSSITGPIKFIGKTKSYAGLISAAGETTGEVKSGSTATLQYIIKIDDDATSGVYYVPLTVVWKTEAAAEKSDTLNVGVEVEGNADLRISSISTNPSKVYPDSDFNLSLGIGNTGGDKAKSVKVTLSLPAEFEGENSASLGTISSSGTATASFNLKCLKTATSKTYNIPIDIEYIDEKGIAQTLTRSFDLFVDTRGDVKIQIGGVTTSPTKIYPDTAFSLTLTLENTGDQDAKAMQVDLELPTEFSGETTAFLGTLSKDSSSTSSFDLRASKSAQEGETYTFTVKTRFDDESGIEHEEEKTFEVFVLERGNIKLDIAGVNTSPTRILADTDFSVSVTLENSGDQDAKSTGIDLVLPEGFSGETTAFLGTIKADASATAAFDLKTAKETAAGEAHNVVMKIGYKDENGAPYSVEKNFTLFVHKRGDIALSIAGLSTSPTTVYPGSKFTLSIQLENTGTQDAKSVKIDVTLPKEFIGERSSFVGEIEQDDVSSGIFDLRLLPKANSGSYDVNMKVRYSDEKGAEFADDMSFTLFVDEAPKNRKGTIIILLLVIGVSYYLWKKRRVKIE
ncbi:MAG: CARDB domain-containing protein [Candidatus Hydrothermarchaeales archaeon]